MVALKYFNGNFAAAMRNFYTVIYIKDEKFFGYLIPLLLKNGYRSSIGFSYILNNSN